MKLIIQITHKKDAENLPIILDDVLRTLTYEASCESFVQQLFVRAGTVDSAVRMKPQTLISRLIFIGS